MNSKNNISQKQRVYTIRFHSSKFLVRVKLIYGERNENWLLQGNWDRFGVGTRELAIWDDGSALLIGVWVTQVIAFIKVN